MKKVIITISAITVIFCGLILTLLLFRQPSDEIINLNSLKQGTYAHINKDGKLNINTATKEELQLLDGIGEVLSQKIVNYRTENGYFKSVDDLLNISGIGPATLEGIADYIYIE